MPSPDANKYDSDPKQADRFAHDPTVGLKAICFSGGGFRATFFHLGVLKLLLDIGGLRFLKDVFAVSGGSILAAAVAVNWDRLSANAHGGVEAIEAYDDIVNQLRGIAQSDIRGRIIRRWIALRWLPRGRYRRVRLLQRQYEEQLSSSELGSFARRPSQGGPDFRFLATSLTTGRSVEFTAEGFDDGSMLHRAAHIKLAFAVAASSAFPPMFPPLRVTHEDLDVPLAQFTGSAQELTDGGIYGNVGIGRMAEIVSGYPHPNNVVFISDASAPFSWEATDRPSRMFVSRHARSFEILMKRIADLEDRCLRLPNARVIRFSIEDSVRAEHLDSTWAKLDAQDEKIQKRVAGIRTDLDIFSDTEICALMRHGYEVALKQIIKADMHRGEYVFQDPCKRAFPDMPSPGAMTPAEIDRIRDVLTAASRRSWGVWNRGDPASWGMLAALATYTSLGAAVVIVAWRAIVHLFLSG